VLADFTANGRAFSLLAVDQERIVGMLDLKAGKWSANRHAGSFGMSLLSGYRGRGLGRRLLQAALDEVRSWEGFGRLELEVAAWNRPAISLYERFGFTVEGVKKGAFARCGVKEDMLMMALVW
jgi:RimJ/RimL family protein N-acetyltransferase